MIIPTQHAQHSDYEEESSFESEVLIYLFNYKRQTYKTVVDCRSIKLDRIPLPIRQRRLLYVRNVGRRTPHISILVASNVYSFLSIRTRPFRKFSPLCDNGIRTLNAQLNSAFNRYGHSNSSLSSLPYRSFCWNQQSIQRSSFS